MSVVWLLSNTTPSRLLKAGLSGSTLIFVRLEQPENSPPPMTVTFAGMAIVLKLTHPANVAFPMFVRPCPSVTLVNPEQPKKGPMSQYPVSRSTTLSGMVMLPRLVHILKASLPIVVTWLPRLTVANSPHSAKASTPMLVTPLPIVTFVRPVQARNASSPMLAMPLGMVTLVRLEQYENAKFPMLVTG